MDIEALVKEVILTATDVRFKLGKYFNESIYQAGLLRALKKKGIQAEKEAPINIYLDGEVITELRVDILVENKLILELKATPEITVHNEKQLLSYLKASGIDDGLLINFGADKIQIARKFRTYRPKAGHIY